MQIVNQVQSIKAFIAVTVDESQPNKPYWTEGETKVILNEDVILQTWTQSRPSKKAHATIGMQRVKYKQKDLDHNQQPRITAQGTNQSKKAENSHLQNSIGVQPVIRNTAQ